MGDGEFPSPQFSRRPCSPQAFLDRPGPTIGGSVFVTRSVPPGHVVTQSMPELHLKPPGSMAGRHFDGTADLGLGGGAATPNKAGTPRQPDSDPGHPPQGTPPPLCWEGTPKQPQPQAPQGIRDPCPPPGQIQPEQ